MLVTWEHFLKPFTADGGAWMDGVRTRRTDWDEFSLGVSPIENILGHRSRVICESLVRLGAFA